MTTRLEWSPAGAIEHLVKRAEMGLLLIACLPQGSQKHPPDHLLIVSWSFPQLATFIADQADRVGLAVEWSDPAYTSQTCPECRARSRAQDRRDVCKARGWSGQRDAVVAITNSRRSSGTGRRGDRAGAT